MLICRDSGLLFIKTKKTAGTSIEIALSSLLGKNDLASPLLPNEEALRPGRYTRTAVRRMVRTLRARSEGAIRARFPHHGFDVAKTYLGDEIVGCYSFCVERNPYDKVVSGFHYVHKRQGRGIVDLAAQFKNYCRSPWLRAFSNIDMYYCDGAFLVDRVLQYDKLDEEFAQVIEHLNIPDITLSTIKAKAGLRPKLELRAYYGDQFDNEAAKLVEETFAREFKVFGYTKPDA